MEKFFYNKFHFIIFHLDENTRKQKKSQFFAIPKRLPQTLIFSSLFYFSWNHKTFFIHIYPLQYVLNRDGGSQVVSKIKKKIQQGWIPGKFHMLVIYPSIRVIFNLLNVHAFFMWFLQFPSLSFKHFINLLFRFDSFVFFHSL